MKKLFLSLILSSIVLSNLCYGGECPANNCDTKKEVEAVVEVFNDFIVSVQLGFSFECFNPDSDKPVLSCFTGLNRGHCLKKAEKLRFIASCISADWFVYTGNKEVDIYDLEKEVLFRIDNKGRFYSVGIF